jgi:hypothetical protein
MQKCYLCGRGEEEVKKYLIEILKGQMEERIKPIIKNEEVNRDRANELKNQWFILKKIIPDEFVRTFDLTIGAISNEIGNIKIPEINKVLEFVNTTLGAKAAKIKLSELSEAIEAKIREATSETKLNENIASQRKWYEERIAKIEEDKGILIRKGISTRRDQENSTYMDIPLYMCKICNALIIEMMPDPY